MRPSGTSCGISQQRPLRNLRSEIEATGGSPDLTKNEIELVRFIYEGSFDWRAFLAKRSGA
jgi:hypothetical protein